MNQIVLLLATLKIYWGVLLELICSTILLVRYELKLKSLAALERSPILVEKLTKLDS